MGVTRLLVPLVLCCSLQGTVQSRPAVPASAAGGSQSSPATLPAAQRAAVDAAVQAEMARQGIVGAAVGILQGGKGAYLQGYGQADREQGVPVSTETVFNWASNSKPLTAVAAIQLVEAGLLDLDADVRRYVPEFPDKGATITMRQILCHQSGIPHYSNGRVVPADRLLPIPAPYTNPVLALDTFSQSPLIFHPGTRYSYSSYAYILASAVVQRAGGEGFVSQVRRRIAEPVGMASLQLDIDSEGQPHWAAGYTRDGQGRVIRAPEEANFWKHGAGAFKSDVQDFARWAAALLNRKLVSEASEKRMWTAQLTTSGETTPYGLGFGVSRQGETRISHSGGQPEATSWMAIYPASARGIVVMTNCGFARPQTVGAVVEDALKWPLRKAATEQDP